MLRIPVKKVYFLILILTGCAYFSVISNLAMSDFWQGEMVLFPLQLIAIAYLGYTRRMKHNNVK